jgi:hypothetical protein
MNFSARNSSAVTTLLALTICLFGLTAQLAAQPPSEQTLQGLRGIELVIKYGQVNGQPQEWQSTILQKLEDLAKPRLKEAGVRIEPADETSRARLVFTITLNRANRTAAPVLVEAALYQRVRLWRDAAKELEVPTWTMGGVGGPEVTEQMLCDVFNEVNNQFLKNYAAMNPTPSEAPREKSSATSAQLSETRHGFEGLNSTGVYVAIRQDMFTDARQAALQKFLQEAAEARLKEAGIKLVRYTNEEEQAGHANLSVWIKLSQPNSETWAPPIGVESKFSQWVRLSRDPKKYTQAVTWETRDQGNFVKNSNGDLVITDELVLELVNKQVDEFIRALKGANANAISVVPRAKSDPF